MREKPNFWHGVIFICVRQFLFINADMPVLYKEDYNTSACGNAFRKKVASATETGLDIWESSFTAKLDMTFPLMDFQ